MTQTVIKLLQYIDLYQASNLVTKAFPDDQPNYHLNSIFEPHSNRRDIESGIFNRVCWGLFAEQYDTTSRVYKLLGLVGLYSRFKDYNEAINLGWFCVDEAYKRQGFGKILLSHAIDEAGCSGLTYLRLDTTSEPSNAVANRLYNTYGFITIANESDDATYVVRRELILHCTELKGKK